MLPVVERHCSAEAEAQATTVAGRHSAEWLMTALATAGLPKIVVSQNHPKLVIINKQTGGLGCPYLGGLQLSLDCFISGVEYV